MNFIITGASSGIGKELAISLAHAGKTVYAIGRNEARLVQLKNLNPEKINIICADVSIPEDREKIKLSLPHDSKITALINNAAVMEPAGSLEDIDLVKWREQIAINLEAPLFLTTKLIPFLQGGRILNLTTYCSINVANGLGAYGISKAALNMLTKYFQVELKQHKINVTVALPGIVDTNIQKQLEESSAQEMIMRVNDLREQNKLLSAVTAARFLQWLLLHTTDNEFTEKVWDIYDTSHHQHWASGLSIPKI